MGSDPGPRWALTWGLGGLLGPAKLSPTFFPLPLTVIWWGWAWRTETSPEMQTPRDPGPVCPHVPLPLSIPHALRVSEHTQSLVSGFTPNQAEKGSCCELLPLRGTLGRSFKLVPFRHPFEGATEFGNLHADSNLFP